MIKKWSYVGAMLLTASCGLVFTGCIDNDEPYGIEQIRVATANLLEAKKAAVNAAQAAEDAKIEIEKIQAETEKIRLENERIVKEAEAKKLEAEAKAIELRAQADAALTEAEAARLRAEADRYQAEADRIKAETESEVARKQAELEEFIAQAEIRVKEAQRQYDEAVYAFQQQQLRDAAYANNELYQAWSMAFEVYLDQLAEVNRLNEEYLRVQRDYALAAIDLTLWNESPKYDRLKALENAVADIENEIAQQNADIDFYNQYIAYLKNFQSSDEFYQLYEKYKEEKEANLKALADANVELATLAVDNKDLYDSRKALEAEVNAFRTDHVVEIPAYTWEPDATLAAIGLTEMRTVVPEGASFTLDDMNDYDNAYNSYLDLIDDIKSYLLDENDIAWTQIRINEMTRELGYANNHYATAKNNWNNAKKAYNNGDIPDFNVIPMEAEVNKALADFAAGGAEAISLRQAYLDAKEDRDAKYKAMEAEGDALAENPASQANKYTAIVDARSDADAAAYEAFEAANDAADAAYDSAKADADRAENAAWTAANTAYYDWQQTITDNASAAVQQKAEDEYNSKYQAAVKQEEKSNEARQKAYDARVKAQNTANNTYQKAIIANQDKYEADMLAWQKAGGSDLAKDPAAANYLAAQKAFNEASDAAWDAYQEFMNYDINTLFALWNDVQTAFNQQSAQVGGWNTNNIWTLLSDLNDFTDVFVDENAELPAFPTTFAPSHLQKNAVFTNVKQYLINTSRVAYGSLGVDYDNNRVNPWDIDEAFVTTEVTKDMVDAYIAENYPWLAQFDYPYYYNLLFGQFGKKLALENRIEVAQAMIDNQSLLSNAIQPLQDKLDALQASYKETEEEGAALTKQWQDVCTQIETLEADVLAKIEDLEHWNRVYGWVLSDITANIGMLMGEDFGGESIEDVVNNSIAYANELIAVCNNRIEALNEQLERAKYQLDQYVNNEGTINANPYEIALETAEARLNAAKERLAFLKARADELQAKYEAANK